jgi:uncharacterized repeat protein (TIGR01451 family)
VTKTVSTGNATMGQQFTYTITVNNTGPDPATGVVLTDPVPAGACLNSVSTSPVVGNYTYTGNAIKWSIGNLAVNNTVILSVAATAVAAGVLTNTAIVSGNESDPNPGNNSATAAVIVSGTSTPAADLAVSVASCPAMVTAGHMFTYLISAINNGPSQADGVVVSDTVPSGLSVQSVTTGKGGYTISGSTVTCQIGIMAPNERVAINIVVSPIAVEEFQNTVFISDNGSVPDPNPDNNTDSVMTQVVPAVSLTVSTTPSSDTVIIGATLTYTVIVTNDGPSAANQVIVDDKLPISVFVESISASQGSGCAPVGNNEFLCNLGTIASGMSASIIIVGKPQMTGCIYNTACATSNESAICNNVTSTCTLVKRPDVDLMLTKSHSPERIYICTPINYTLTVTNNGPAAATGIVLTDIMPAGLKLLSVCSSQGQCQSCEKRRVSRKHGCHPYNNEVICQLGSLAAGASATVWLCAEPCHWGVFINMAIVTANEEDTNLANNQVTDAITVITLSEQVDDLLNLIKQLAATGSIAEEKAADMLENMETVRELIAHNSTDNVHDYLESFIKTVKSYVNHDQLSASAGHVLTKVAENIRQQLGCAHACLHQGGE